MLQVMCRQSPGKRCDGTCGDPQCVVAHNRECKITFGCSECDKLRADLAAAQRELAAYKQAADEVGAHGHHLASKWLHDRAAELLAQEGGK